MKGAQTVTENQKKLEKNKIDCKRNTLHSEFDKFMKLLFRSKTILFQDFLENTSVYFDTFIQDTSKKEKLNYIAGKFLMEKKNSAWIHFTAEFYFQDADQQWILMKKEEDIAYDCFSDWETSFDLKQLQRQKKLEFPIDPPLDMR